MTGTAELTTKRLRLRKYCMEDALPLFEEFGCDPVMYEYSGWNPYATCDMAEETVHRFIDSYKHVDFYGWAIEYQGMLIGTIGAYDYVPEKNQIEIGLSIARNFSKKALQKAGMKQTHVIKNGMDIEGKTHDQLFFSYTRSS